MTVSAHLDRLRRGAPGCALVAYGDRSARLVLRTSADAPWRQEHLDALCSDGAGLLDRADRLNAVTGAATPPVAVLADRRDVRVFLGSRGQSDEMLCCVCVPGTDTEALVHECRRVLDHLSGGES